MLTEYFKPLTPLLLLVTTVVFLSLDVIGASLNRHLIKSDIRFRPIYWLFGLGPFIFIWYLLHFYLPFAPKYILATLLTPTLIFLPQYLKNKDFQNLVLYYKSNPLLLLILLTLLPALYVKSSLPPYLTDEVRYHFMSPYQIINQRVWGFGSNSEIYTYVPRLLDTFFALVFSITKSYSPARLLHFYIFFSSVASIYSILKQHFGRVAASLFALTYIYLMPDLLIIATSGYTDYSLAAFIALAIVSTIDFLLTKKLSSLKIATIFFSLSLATKYTALPTLSIYGLITFTILISNKSKKTITSVIKKRNLITLLALLFIFGGYWYANNYIFTGNPVYPFFLPCKLEYCVKPAGFFDGWTIPVTFSNLSMILSQITTKAYLSILLLGSVLIIVKTGSSKQRLVLNTLLIGIFLELFLLRFYSGFLQRYYYYLQILVIILIVLPAQRYRWYALLVSLFTLFGLVSNLRNTYDIWRYLSPQEIAYARGKTNIYTWIKDRHPQNVDIIKFCADTGPQTLYILDQDIWHTKTNEQYMSIFNINCTYASAPVPSSSFWFATTKTCADEPLVCMSQAKGKNLYYLEK